MRLTTFGLPEDLLARLRRLADATGEPAVMYARISQDRTGAGLGVDRQLGDLCDLFERFRLRLVGVYADNDLSAYSGKSRPDYLEMLADLAAGRAKLVTAWHTDRLHRSPVELEDYINVCDPREIVTHTVKAGHIDLSTPSGRMVARQLGAVARFESEHKSDRIKAARLQAAQDGRWHGGERPFGVEADGVTIRPAEAAEIVKATEAILAGVGLRSVVRDLNERDFRTTFGVKEWAPRSFKDVLLRPRNAGLAVYRGEVIGPASWPAIVPEDTWRALVSVLTDPSRRTTPGSRTRWLGSGLYLCGVCGRPDLRVSTAGGTTKGRKPAYRCRARQRVATTGHVVRDAAMLDAYVEELLVARLERPDAVELLRAPDVSVDTTALHAEATAVRQRLTDLSALFADGDITAAQLKDGTERLRVRLDNIEHTIGNATRLDPLVGIVGAPDVARLWFGTAEDRSDGLRLGRRRAVLDAIVSVTVLKTTRGQKAGGVYFDSDGVLIEWKQ